METLYAKVGNNNEQRLNLHQRAIRVEMLTSPFSVPVFYDAKNETVKHFVGVNAEIIKVLSAVMNFSGNF